MIKGYENLKLICESNDVDPDEILKILKRKKVNIVKFGKDMFVNNVEFNKALSEYVNDVVDSKSSKSSKAIERFEKIKFLKEEIDVLRVFFKLVYPILRTAAPVDRERFINNSVFEKFQKLEKPLFDNGFFNKNFKDDDFELEDVPNLVNFKEPTK